MSEFFDIYITIVIILGSIHGIGVAIIGLKNQPAVLAFNNDTMSGYFLIGLISGIILIGSMFLSVTLYPIIVINSLYNIIKKKRGKI